MMNNEEEICEAPDSDDPIPLKKGRHKLGYVVFVITVLFMVGFITISTRMNRSALKSPELRLFTKTSQDDGGVRYEKKDQPKFAISLPQSWKVVEIDPQNVEAAATEENKILPNWGNDIENDKQYYQCCVKLDAINIEQNGLEDLQVGTDTLAGNPNLDSYVEAQAVGFNKQFSPSQPVTHSHIDYPGIEAEVLKVSRNQKLPNGQNQTQFITQYYFLKNQDIFIVTLGNTSEIAAVRDQQAAAVERVGQSFEWLPE